MPIAEFCCRSGGSNMNGGRIASNGEPATTPVYSATNGGWNSGTGVFTPTSGDPSASVTVGDYAHVFVDGATTPTFIGRVTARDSTTITVSTTAKGGTAPTTAGAGVSINVGGAWAGPSGASGFPFNFVTGAMTSPTGAPPRVNFKNDQTYNITANMPHSLVGPVIFQGYTSTFGDLGRATIDGGTSGASYALLTLSGSGIDKTQLTDLIFQNNGATGTANGVTGLGDGRTAVWRCVVNNIRGAGFDSCGVMVECEAYACNKSNTANLAGFIGNGSIGGFFVRCISHDNNAGTNAHGFYSQGASIFLDCIAAENAGSGILSNNVTSFRARGCDLYANAHGITLLTAASNIFIENCNFFANTTYGINNVSAAHTGFIMNCAFGSGTMANGSGNFQIPPASIATSNLQEIGSITYTANLTPWSNPAAGVFTQSASGETSGDGRGSFTTTAASYGPTVGYPDIGAAPAQPSAGGGGGQRVYG
jgi:hypothetical protein